jgi:hypothetical protein
VIESDDRTAEDRPSLPSPNRDPDREQWIGRLAAELRLQLYLRKWRIAKLVKLVAALGYSVSFPAYPVIST